MSIPEKKIISAPDLKSFFFESLNQINQKSLCPLPQETIYYSTLVLDRFALSEQFFELNEGKLREKILGLKFLEAGMLDHTAQPRSYQEIGDMSLIVCGYFSESVNRKILDLSYYAKIGKMAYSTLDNYVPRFLEIPGFYKILSTTFEPLTILLGMLAKENRSGDARLEIFQKVLADQATEAEQLSAGILPTEKKVS
jgi:hypothetical protein